MGGAAGLPEPEPLGMFGQFLVEPELELEPEPEFELFDPEPDELDEPELDVPDPLLVVLVVVPDDGVVVEELVLVVEPVVPVLDVVVVAASATSAPPVTRPAVSAPIANTFRNRSFILGGPFVSCCAPLRPERQSHDAPSTCDRPHNDRRAWVALPRDRMTMLRRRAWRQAAPSGLVGRAQRRRRRRSAQRLVARQQYARIGTSITSRPARNSCSSRKRRIASRCWARSPSSMVITML